MLRVSDKYFLGSFVKTFLFAQVSFLIIFVVVDLVSQLDLFIDKQATIRSVALYYFYFSPFFFGLVMPIAMLMASLFTTGQFVRYGELTAMKAAGMSLYRIFLPVFIFSIFISIFSFWLGEAITPEFQRKKMNIKRYVIEKENPRYTLSNTNINLQDSQTRIVTIANYDAEKNIAYQISVQEMNGNRIITLINAVTMIQFDEFWKLVNVKIRDFSSGEERFSEADNLIVDDFSFTTEDLKRIQIKPDEMNIVELKDYIEKLRNMGSPFGRWIVDLHQKIAFPFANFIVVLLGMPLATRSWRGGAAVGFGLSIFICFVYYVVMTLSISFGYKGSIHPVVAPWISNTLFGLTGFVSLITAKK
ncbi:LptF/LptG family permease [candidate division KSB1 bacterium]